MVCFKSIMLSKPQMCLDLTRSRHPSFDGDWALKRRDTRRFETTVTLGTPFGLMDSRRYRVLAATPFRLTRMGSRLALRPILIAAKAMLLMRLDTK
jgi:hypothetical protein